MPYNMDAANAADSQSSAVPQPKRAVQITLDVSSDDDIRTRRFMLKPSSHAIQVGRSSRSDENFMPAETNAWFDSRVISRNHAVFRASPEEQKLYLCDDGSMHGSYVNEKKVSNGEMYPLRPGDKVVFGCSIVRGPEKFAPVTATIEFEWFKDLSPTRLSNRAYVVPLESDFDDDGVEFLQESACNSKISTEAENGIGGGSRKFSVPESDASSAGSFEHDEPNSKDIEFPSSAFKLHTDSTDVKTSNVRADRPSAGPTPVTGSARSEDIEKLNAEIVDGVASIPTKMPMTHPTAITVDPTSIQTPEAQKSARVELHGTAGLSRTDSAKNSPDIYLTESDSDKDVTSQLSLESSHTPVDSISSPAEIMDDNNKVKITWSNRGCKLSLGGKENTRCFDEYSDEELSDVESTHTNESDSCGSDISSPVPNDENIPTSSTYPRTFHPTGNQGSAYPGLPTALKYMPVAPGEAFPYARDPSPSDAALAKPSFATNPSAPRFGTEWNYPCQVPMTSDFAFQRPGGCGEYPSYSLPDHYYRCQSPPSLRPYTDGPFSSFQCNVGSSPLTTGLDVVPDHAETQHPLNNPTPATDSVHKPTTKVSIDSIVEKSEVPSPEAHPTSSLKRKHAEITQDDDQVEGSPARSFIEDTFPDAQIRMEPPTPMDNSGSTEINIIATENESSEPPTKKVRLSLEELPHKPVKKSSRTKQFAKYAATAVGGALIGAVGVVGALVALPEGFFS